MSDIGFDLLTRGWVRVRDDDGLSEQPLREVFARAHEIRALAGEIVTQDVAILRLLLAILHRAVGDMPGTPTDMWRHLWKSPTLPMREIDAYLDSVADRFDLFGERAPFFQVAGLSAGKTSGLVKLVADVPDGHPYFTTRAGRGMGDLSLAEAARWVVHCQAFDPSGIKTGVTGDPRTKGGKGYPIGTGWSGRCGLIVLEGDTLKETLLLNLVLGLGESDDDPDLPVWERATLGPGVEKRHPEPLGPADVFTWPSRRLRLVRDSDRVADLVLGNGDPIHARNRHGVEPMTAWRRSANQEKQIGGLAYMPRQHDPSRALWRGLSGLLVDRPRGGAIGNDAPADLPPATLAWLADLTRDGALDPATRVRLRAVGIRYGTQDASIETVYDDALGLRVAIASDPDLRSTALDAAAAGEAAAHELGSLAANLAAAAGRNVDGPRERAREQAFHAVGLSYGSWLASLTPDSDPDRELSVWQHAVRDLLWPMGESLIEQAGQAAWVGREVRGKHLDTSLAWLYFRSGLRRALPATTVPEPERPHHDQPIQAETPTSEPKEQQR